MVTGQLFGVARRQLLIFGIGLSGLRFARCWNRSGMTLLSSALKSFGAGVTAGVPVVGNAGTSVTQHVVQPFEELEEEELDELDDNELLLSVEV